MPDVQESQETGSWSTSSGTEIWRLATALSGAARPLDVAVVLAEQGAAAAGAAFSNMAVLEGGRSWVIHGRPLDDDLAERWSVIERSQRTPLGDAMAGRRPVLLGDLGAIGASYPHLLDDTRAAGLAATASLPLLTATGAAAGAAGFAWTDPQAFGEDQARLLDLIARMAASALERAVLYDQQLATIHDRETEDAQFLQNLFLPRELPHVEGLAMAATYLPASDAAMGGDWYDVFSGRDGTCFAIGDVAGHGLQAAAVMTHLRNALRAYGVEHASPGDVLTQLNRVLCHLEPTETATAIVVAWDPPAGVIHRANAGHLPILRCRADGVDYLKPQRRGPLLGADPGWVYGSESKQLRPGTTLLFYTDGLVEQRGSGLDEGMEALRSFVETLDDLAPQALCDRILEWRLDDGPREDDICMLAVRLA